MALSLPEQLNDALNKLAKWRSVFAGWQLGTRSKEDPECQAVRDHREVTMLMRAELNALTKVLLDKKVFTVEEFQTQLLDEATYLDKAYEEKFPGIKTTDIGVSFTEASKFTMKNWKP